jgi:hypothetical protein
MHPICKPILMKPSAKVRACRRSNKVGVRKICWGDQQMRPGMPAASAFLALVWLVFRLSKETSSALLIAPCERGAAGETFLSATRCLERDDPWSRRLLSYSREDTVTED